MIREELTAIAIALRGADRVLLSTHVNPDGDAVGSVLALRGMLEAIGIDATVVMEDETPLKYAFLSDHPVRLADDPTLGEEAAERPFDMAVFVDASERSRLGTVGERMTEWMVEGAPVANIDHHVGNTRFGDLIAVDGMRASCAELLLDLARILEVPLTSVLAAQLYAGVLTDTGRFTFANTTPDALRAAGELVEAGANPTRITEQIYFERPAAYFQLIGDILSRLELRADGQICVITLTEETRQRYFPSGPVDSEGIVDFTVQIDGVELGVFIRQVGDQAWRVSLRSRGEFDVRPIAEQLGGGGHEKAAGCGLEGDFEEVLAQVTNAMESVLL